MGAGSQHHLHTHSVHTAHRQRARARPHFLGGKNEYAHRESNSALNLSTKADVRRPLKWKGSVLTTTPCAHWQRYRAHTTFIYNLVIFQGCDNAQGCSKHVGRALPAAPVQAWIGCSAWCATSPALVLQPLWPPSIQPLSRRMRHAAGTTPWQTVTAAPPACAQPCCATQAAWPHQVQQRAPQPWSQAPHRAPSLHHHHQHPAPQSTRRSSAG